MPSRAPACLSTRGSWTWVQRALVRRSAAASLPSDVLHLIQGGQDLLDRARQAVAGARARPLAEVTLLAPIPRPPKIVCIGVNDVELA